MIYSLFYFLFFIYEEILYKLLNSATFHLSFIATIFYVAAIAFILGIIASSLPEKTNKHLLRINIFIVSIYYGICIVVKRTFGITISIDALKMYKQFLTGGFSGETIKVVGQSLPIIGLIVLPLIVSIILTVHYHQKHRFKIKKFLINLLISIISFCLFICCCFYDNKDNLDSLYFDKNNNTLNVEYFGVLPSLCIDIRKKITGFEEKIELEETVKETNTSYGKNTLDLNLDEIESDSSDINNIISYIQNDTGTSKNEYTGIYKGKNLIYIMAESFDSYFVSEELTPTLYKMIHNGLYFSNYYSPTNLSTIGGEFSLLTGLLPDLTELNTVWQSDSSNYYPYGLGTLFSNLGYSTYAYHDHTYNYQGRDKYLKSLGFDNYKGCWNGLEDSIACTIFPESDNEMIEATVSDYINDDNFMVYYVTVSGHGSWDFVDNDLAIINKDLVDDIEGSDTVRAYIAANLELERAMTTLIETLEENGKLDDTVIVLAADHHPYFMSDEEMEELAGKELDQFSLYKNDLIIYNSATENVTIDKYCETIDVLPTTLNLFGINYDSRLMVGKDILSDSDGIVIFADNSWITDEGKYEAATGTFITSNSFTGDEEEYINKINNRVTNKYSISRNIIEYNFYDLLMK